MDVIRPLFPDWPAPACVGAAVTTRAGGVSLSAYASLNLGDHVGDDPAHVTTNRARLRAALALRDEPAWLQQVHGTAVVDLAAISSRPAADGAVSFSAGPACAILTADCLPVLFCDRAGTRVGAAHAGWRGLAAGVLGATLRALEAPPQELLAWLGPAIGPRAFEVGPEVRAAFLRKDAGSEACFCAKRSGHWLADLYALARRELRALGLSEIYGGESCTYTERDRFYSYRRDGTTGRMAALIWLK